MNDRVIAIVNNTKKKFGLHHYYLAKTSIWRSVTICGQTEYVLNMEWFPHEGTEESEDGMNPVGTASIDIDIHTKKIHSVIFVGAKAYTEPVTFDWTNREVVIDWVEKETALTYGNQFQLSEEEEGTFHFKANIDGVAISPSSDIQVKFDKEGRLIFFSIHGPFPTRELAEEVSFSLTLEQIEDVIENQLKLVYFPQAQNKIIPAYGIEEIYVKNDRGATMSTSIDKRSRVHVNEIMEWDEPLENTFESVTISMTDEVSLDVARAREPHPDVKPISKLEVERCITSVREFLRQQYSNQTGEWLLQTLHRENGYILATLIPTKPDLFVFQRKMVLFIDEQSYDVLNVIDNEAMLDKFQAYEEEESVHITKEEAGKTLRPHLELTPYYVYDVQQDKYVLCGKLDCQEVVHAANGEIVRLRDL
ncbi:hypothetical protein [Pontibacillus litoralis]|uniref:DUF4901 domain-containing protein n=1 Tax=Pontibacillus litoralis JSM 072002 TaxID=1385512 RepID=A0A0A5HMC1_9BACI|nr:hypothetical protein [Pontibacillus litoralis]KGX84777.1 hypothetical protein N784_11845 [Pontibacillus litoralis JSM 072002]